MRRLSIVFFLCLQHKNKVQHNHSSEVKVGGSRYDHSWLPEAAAEIAEACSLLVGSPMGSVMKTLAGQYLNTCLQPNRLPASCHTHAKVLQEESQPLPLRLQPQEGMNDPKWSSSSSDTSSTVVLDMVCNMAEACCTRLQLAWGGGRALSPHLFEVGQSHSHHEDACQHHPGEERS